MDTKSTKQRGASGRRRQSGMSLLEMVLASAILMVGILSVVQLVPATLQLDVRNRMDTMATVIAQRELDQMLAQLQCSPQNPACHGLSTPGFVDSAGNNVSLDGSSSSGSPVVMVGPTPVIDFSAGLVDGFNVQGYQDPNDPNFPNGATFELRWAVIQQPFPPTNGIVLSKRIIIGCRQTNANQPVLPVTLDTAVQK